MLVAFATLAPAQGEKEEALPQTLIQNVKIFDGVNEKLVSGNVLVEGHLIKAVGKNAKGRADATVIDGGGRFLMPGMADMHVHIASFTPVQTHSRDMLHPYAHGALAADRAEGMLLNGFTTIRDMGGAANFFRKIADADVMPGPRIYPSENWITTTSGHFDFREYNDPHPNIAGGRQHFYDEYVTIIADGPAEHMRAAREAFRHGATQLKIATSGGITSLFDPLHSGPEPEEIQAVVAVANRWDTYVAAHAFSEEAILLAINNGVRCIEHAPFITDEIAKVMIEKGIYLAAAPSPVLDVPVEQARKAYPKESFVKWKRVRDAAEEALKVWGRNPELKVVLGSDHVPQWNNGRDYDKKALRDFVYFSQALGNYRTLKAVTSLSGELNALTGKMNPYKDGPLGVIREGAYADVLIIEGNPLEDIEVMLDPHKNFKIIMKDGKVYKNTLKN